MARIKNSIQIQIEPGDNKHYFQDFHYDDHQSRSCNNNNNNIINHIKEEDQEAINRTKPPSKNLCTHLFLLLFFLHFLFTTMLIIFLTIHSFFFTPSDHHLRDHFNLLHWYEPLLTSSLCASIFAFSFQVATRFSPPKSIKTAFFLAPFLTFSSSILLLAIGSTGSFAIAALALISSLVLALYACWIVPRLGHTIKILQLSLSIATSSTNSTNLSLPLSLLIATTYSCLSISGLAATTTKHYRFQLLFDILILLSLSWTLHIIKNLLQVKYSLDVFFHFYTDYPLTDASSCSYTTERFGSVCLGSVIEPVVGMVRGVAQAMSSIGGNQDEFMFSCASCFAGVARKIVEYGNRWAFVEVGAHGKRFVRASMETWEKFERADMVALIEDDLTGSFCFMCGVVGGSLCTLVGGSWALAVEKSQATAVSIYAFLIGYLMVRIGMAGPQACVSAYYVAYAENPQNVQFDSTIPDRIQELRRSNEEDDDD